jgi:hypothetical protein
MANQWSMKLPDPSYYVLDAAYELAMEHVPGFSLYWLTVINIIESKLYLEPTNGS